MIPYQLGSVTGDGLFSNVLQAVKVPNGQKGPQEGKMILSTSAKLPAGLTKL